MKNAKFMIMTLLMCLSLVSFGQTERVSVSLPKIQTTPTKILNKATGWGLHENGQWISSANKIPALNETSLEIDNFVSYDFRDIIINDTIYTLFLKKYNTGWWTYPSIYSGWNPTISGEYFVLNKKDIDSIKIINDFVNLIILPAKYHGYIDNAPIHKKWDNATYIKDIQEDISTQISKNTQCDHRLILHIAPYKSKNIVRFQIYSSYSKYNIISTITDEYKPKDPNGKYSWDTIKIYGTNQLFDYCYYETDYVTFSKFLKLS